jgi:hypothetical protein
MNNNILIVQFKENYVSEIARNRKKVMRTSFRPPSSRPAKTGPLESLLDRDRSVDYIDGQQKKRGSIGVYPRYEQN